METASGSGDVRTTAAKCDVCECDLDGEKGDEGREGEDGRPDVKN